MKPLFRIFALLTLVVITHTGNGQSFWRQVDESTVAREKKKTDPARYLLFSADEAALKQKLFALLRNAAEAEVMTLPMPDGTMKNFRVWHSPIMPGKLAQKYPGLRTFNAVCTSDSRITAKLDYTSFGFHGEIFDGEDVSFIDPAKDSGSGVYMSHYRRDELRRPDRAITCGVRRQPASGAAEHLRRQAANRTIHGDSLFTYRLALTADNFYARAATGLTNPTIAQTLSKMMTTMNRVNGVYERELSVTMNFVENEDTLIFPSATGSVNGTDPFDSVTNDSASLCLYANQALCNARIGSDNYDIGHVFTTGAGGLSYVGVACDYYYKAMSVTGLADPVGDGFDIDYVTHEMGHEYGADHPFNDDSTGTGSCNLYTIYGPTAYEPGSGSTIMAYAGICPYEDLQPHSDAYFNSISLIEISEYIASYGGACPVKTPTYNKPVYEPPFQASYTIPYLTPFELTAPAATDSAGDTTVTYCWEQWNLGDFGKTLVSTHNEGPIFRSYFPTTSTTRIFPKNEMVLSGVLSNAGIENNQGEKVPDVARFLTFHLTVRDIYQGYGCFLIPDDTLHLDVVNTGSGFAVTSQGDSATMYFGGTQQQVTWNAVGTNAAPINATNVDIYLSTDGGNTWGTFIGTFPNTGAATITLPNPGTSVYNLARIKVKGSGNVFFNVNAANFSLLHDDGTNAGVKLFPVPASNFLYVSAGDVRPAFCEIYNSVGQRLWTGEVTGELKIPLYTWASGLYILKFTDAGNHRTVKKFEIE